MKNGNGESDIDWIYSLKKEMLIGLLGFIVASMVVAMVLIALSVRTSLLADSADKSQELEDVIQSSLRVLMIKRDPGLIQDSIDQVVKGRDSILRARILDRQGRIVFSSDHAEIGTVLNRFAEESCRGCHNSTNVAPSVHTLITTSNGVKVQRNVKVIYNEPACHGCHSPSDRINGKLIVDRSLQRTDALIASIQWIIAASGGVCLLFIAPFLRRRIDTYIAEILNKGREVTLLVTIAKRLSETIDTMELRQVVVTVVGETFDADEVEIIHPRDPEKYRVYVWERGTSGLSRGMVNTKSERYSIIRDWLAGSLKEQTVTTDGKQVYIPIIKGESGLALIGIRKKDEPFNPDRLKFIGAVCSHLAIAFENAYLYSIAISDELTDLFSPRHFRFCIEREITHFEKNQDAFTLLLIDIDDFKRVNDTHGHVAGDDVLKESAHSLTSSVRDNDLCFRYGGEEFAVLLPATDVERARPVAERIRDAFEQRNFSVEGVQVRLTISIGMASCPKTAVASRDLIIAADKALYQAKKMGKNRIVVSGEEE